MDSKNVEEFFIKAKGGVKEDRFGGNSFTKIIYDHPLLSIVYVNRCWNIRKRMGFLNKAERDQRLLINCISVD